MPENKSLDTTAYLIKLGLRKPGQRGRLSYDSLEALDKAVKAGITFANWDNETKRYIKAAPSAVAKPKTEKKSIVSAERASTWRRVRNETKMTVLCNDGAVVVLDIHGQCGRTISTCVCREILPPAYLQAVDFELVV